MTNRKSAILCIMDGWGWRMPPTPDNAITEAHTPVFDSLLATCPHSLLRAAEEAVGLPEGQMGNSEVGHTNLGAGRVVYQDFPLIDRTLAQNEMESKPALVAFIAALKKSGGAAHVFGLASPGGVHSHQRHIVALAKIIAANDITVNIHAFTDGRDVPPDSAAAQIKALRDKIVSDEKIHLATLCGRYYAMDRNQKWDRTEQAYDLITQGLGRPATDAVAAIEQSYAQGVTDEFITPVALNGYQGMKDGDGVFAINFRPDRVRQLAIALLDPTFCAFPRKKKITFANALGMVEYSAEINAWMSTLFPQKDLKNVLGEVVAAHGLKQLRIAESEKYAHVTFFLNGGRETPYDGEDRVLIPSPKVATYDLKPEMSAVEITDRVVPAIESAAYALIVINFANADMVGHTGDLKAAIKAVETVDACVGRIVEAAKKVGCILFLTADHGNCEIMADPETGGPHTAHTTSLVPAILVNAPGITTLRDGNLADVAPTLLTLMEIPVPPEMSGKALI